MTKTTTPDLFNAFTKSYKLRYRVHAAPKKADKTICGRAVEKIADKAPFDEDAEGSCLRCIQKLEIARRIHPGFED